MYITKLQKHVLKNLESPMHAYQSHNERHPRNLVRLVRRLFKFKQDVIERRVAVIQAMVGVAATLCQCRSLGLQRRHALGTLCTGIQWNMLVEFWNGNVRGCLAAKLGDFGAEFWSSNQSSGFSVLLQFNFPSLQCPECHEQRTRRSHLFNHLGCGGRRNPICLCLWPGAVLTFCTYWADVGPRATQWQPAPNPRCPWHLQSHL